MIAKRKATTIALGLGTLGLLAGCTQSPAYQPVQWRYVDPAASAAAMRAYLEQQNFDAWAAPRGYGAPAAAGMPAAAQRPRWFNTHPAALNNDGAMPSSDPPAAPKASADPDCVGWWRICHFL